MRVRMILVSILVLLVACTTSSLEDTTISNERSCDELLEKELHQLMFKKIMLQELLSNVALAEGISENSISIQEVKPNMTLLEWRSENRYYNLAVNNSVPTILHIVNGAGSVHQILNCLGPPERYDAESVWTESNTTLVSMELYYPAKGIRIHASKAEKGRIDPYSLLNENMPISVIIYVEPGTMEELFDRVFSGISPEIRQEWLEKTKPWPRDWDNLVISGY